jgi:hypothetical protein
MIFLEKQFLQLCQKLHRFAKITQMILEDKVEVH